MLNDLRLGARILRRQSALTTVAVLSLAVGIGANTAIFTVLQNVVLSPLPYDDSDRLMMVWETSVDNPTRWVAPANFVDWRRESATFVSLAAFDEFAPTLGGRGEPERLRALGASGTFFTTLGAQAALGRALVPADDEADATSVAVLSDGLWTRLFGRSIDALGQSLLLDGRPYTIVGVMPPAFESPLQTGIDVWLSGDRGVPRSFPFGGDLTAVRDSHILFVVGRLAPGATRAAAQEELTGMMEVLAQRHPDTNTGLGVNVVALHESMVGAVAPLAWLLQLAVALMLLIACANVAHLQLGHAAGRAGEMAMRLALGAERGRLVRQLLAESLVIALPGGALGLLLAVWGLDAIVALAPGGLPRVAEIGINGTVLAFTSGVTLLTALVFGVGPALHLSRAAEPAQVSSNARATGGRVIRRWQDAIVVGELALAEVLLIGAGLLLASFVAAQRVELGFSIDHRVAADLSLAPERYLVPRADSTGGFQIDPTRKLQFVDAVLGRLQAPGVRAAAASFTSPLAGAPNRGVAIAGRPPRGPGLEESADFQLVTSEYFRTLGAVLLAGRPFSPDDRRDRPLVAIVNLAFAETFFPGQDPLGHRVRFGATAEHEIVGVVADMRYRHVERAADPAFYVPLAQNDERWPFLSFTVWMDDRAGSGAPALREAIRAADPQQAITRIRTYDEILAAALAPRRFNTLLVGLFAATALLLAAMGAYGVMAYAVSTRTREIGVRAALGASPRDLLRLMLGRGAVLTATAVTLGVVVALAGARLLEAMLFGVTPLDVQTFSLVAAVLSAAALTATWLPARRAVRVSPLAALREE